MERASADTIAMLLNVVEPRRGARPGGRGSRPKAPPVRNDRRRRCVCGRCRQCHENARWERIFLEKFADPTYYSQFGPRTASPLSSL